MLKEVTGTRLFDEKLAKMEQALNEAQVKKQTLNSVLSEIDTKLEGLQSDKELYKDIELLEMKKKAYQKMLYSNKVEAQRGNLDNLRQQKRDLMKAREVLLEKREKQMAQSSDQSFKLEQLRAQQSQLESELDKLILSKKDL
jgi:structural maintenance of chromosome 3 (chondroitin sulfate proteoglycan 6)